MKTNTMILVGIAAVAVYFVFFRESEPYQFSERDIAVGDSITRSVGYVPITTPLQIMVG